MLFVCFVWDFCHVLNQELKMILKCASRSNVFWAACMIILVNILYQILIYLIAILSINGNKRIDRTLEMTSNAPTNAGKHVWLNIACACSPQNTKDTVFWLAQMTLCITALSNFRHFVKSNIFSGGSTNGLLICHLINSLCVNILHSAIPIWGQNLCYTNHNTIKCLFNTPLLLTPGK